MPNQFSNIKKSLPARGVGLGLRRDLAQETFAATNRIDWLEIISENYMDGGVVVRERLQQAQSLMPVICHGVNLSIGSTDDLNQKYLKSLKVLADRIDTPWFSDHLCFTSFGAHYLHELLPLPFSREAVNHVAKR